MMVGEMVSWLYQKALVSFLYKVTTLKLATLCSQITKRPRSFGGPTRFVVGGMLLTCARFARACQEHTPNHKPCWTPSATLPVTALHHWGGCAPPRPPCTLTLPLPRTRSVSKNTFFFSLLFEKLKIGGVWPILGVEQKKGTKLRYERHFCHART